MAYAARILLFLSLSATAPAVAQTASPARSGTGQAADEVFTYVEQMPEFPGGQAALFQTLGQTIVYPAEALQQRLEGRVFVGFVVAASGNVQDVKVSKSVHPLLDAEAVRAVQALPAFVAGKQKGRPVAVAYTLPITFRLPAAAAPLAPLPTGPRPAFSGRPPYLQGGQLALVEYLKAAPYPEEARQAQASGVVFVSVDVDANGHVSKIGSDAGIGLQNGQATRIMPALRFAAINLVSDGPAWVPAQEKGQNVASSSVIPVQFDAASGTVSVIPGIRLFPEVPPTNPDGPEAYLKLIAQRLRYPSEALRRQVQGKVMLFLPVSKEGRIEKPLVIESVSPDLDAEALRVAALLPPIFPALEDGQPVSSYYLLPITFSIQ